MKESLTFILNELGGKTLSDDLRNEVVSACQEFQHALEVVSTKLANDLWAALNSVDAHLGYDLDDFHPETLALIESIGRSIRDKTEVMHQLVMKFRNLSEQDNDKFGSVSSLLTNLCADILSAQAATQEELSFIAERLENYALPIKERREKGLINAISLYKRDTREEYAWCNAASHEQGLDFEGVEAGKHVKGMGACNDWDREHWMIIAPEYRDTILLYLLKEHFTDFNEIKTWIKSKGIPVQYLYER